MKQDWVVWLGCVMLFFSGAIWGGLTIDIKFLKIDSLHDLFEIVGAAATCVAVYVAATWKKQLGSTRDYELARKFSIVSVKYKESVLGAWEAAENSLVQVDSGETLSGAMRTTVKFILEGRVDLAQELRTEIQELLVECRAIWRNGIEQDFLKVIAFEIQCSNCTKHYLSTLNSETNPISSIVSRYSVANYRKTFEGVGVGSSADATVYIESLFRPITEKFDVKMK